MLFIVENEGSAAHWLGWPHWAIPPILPILLSLIFYGGDEVVYQYLMRLLSHNRVIILWITNHRSADKIVLSSCSAGQTNDKHSLGMQEDRQVDHRLTDQWLRIRNVIGGGDLWQCKPHPPQLLCSQTHLGGENEKNPRLMLEPDPIGRKSHQTIWCLYTWWMSAASDRDSSHEEE